MPRLQWRRTLAPFLIIATIIVSVLLFAVHPSVPTGLVVVMSAYRVCNLWRLIKARINEKHLRHVTVQVSVWIIVFQATILALWALGALLHITTYHLWLVLMCADLAGCLMLLSSTIRHLRTTRVPPSLDHNIADKDLPPLTIAIPARNETDDLEACLQSILASTYPKLEVLVLDDCSQNKRTPEIIRGFAHDGVLFVKGSPPEPNWLAKNQAYQRLFEASNGEFLLFCGVDARFRPDSLRRLVTATILKSKTMVSVIPKNEPPKQFLWRDQSLLQPLRYAWELALPRKLFRRPPVLSTCWIIKRDTLESAGGFAAVSRSIVPESYFARVSAVQDGYSFMQSDEMMGITCNKSFAEQQATTVRTRYPQLHRRMELVLTLTLAELVGVIMPLVFIVLAIFGHLSLQLTVLSVLITAILMYIYVQIVALTYRRWLVRAFLLFPIAVILDAILLNYSMLKYEFFSVVWKGRNVCMPVMRVIDRLPPIGEKQSTSNF